jgi:hypothetical protein
MGNRSLLLAAALAALPAAAITEPGGIAASLRVPASEAPAFVLSGNGVYIYQCRQAISDPNTYVWAFVVPDATLYDGSRSVARHATFGLYESLSDRTSVSGVVRSSQPAGGQPAVGAHPRPAHRRERIVRQREQHPARQHDGRGGAFEWLRSGQRRRGGPGRLPGRLLFLQARWNVLIRR